MTHKLKYVLAKAEAFAGNLIHYIAIHPVEDEVQEEILNRYAAAIEEELQVIKNYAGQHIIDYIQRIIEPHNFVHDDTPDLRDHEAYEAFGGGTNPSDY